MSHAKSTPRRSAKKKFSWKRSIKSGPILGWTTDRTLKIVNVTHGLGGAVHSMPVPGMVIEKSGTRRGFLDHAAHLRCLRGKKIAYRYTLLRRTYRIDLEPRRGRGFKVIGVRGRMTLLSVDGDGILSKDAGELPSLKEIARARERSSIAGIIRSLELAKAVADSTRLQAEVRLSQAVRLQAEASTARLSAESAERRAKFLSDASALMDASFDESANLDRVVDLLIDQFADWCVVHIRDGGVCRRITLRCRKTVDGPALEEAFPEEEDGSFFGKALSGQSELFALLSPWEMLELVPTATRSRALRRTRTESAIRVPILIHGKTLGLLTFGSLDPARQYDANDHRMAQSLAHRVALARETARLYQEAQREIALRKEAEARLRIFNQDLERRVRERTQLLEEASREANSFAYTVAHDLRAPLRAITGFCQALKEDYSGAVDEVGQDYLDRIIMGARRMDLLIRDLLDYARLNRAEIRREIVDLDELVHEVRGGMAAELEERRAVLEFAAPLGRVVAQGTVLAQILTNLVSNAVKFVAPGVLPKVKIWTELRDGRIRIVLQDNGIGIAPEHQERIFGIFERLNRAEDYPGTGIGLAIVRRGVERLGGLVGVESAPQKGARFWVELPAPFEPRALEPLRRPHSKSS